MSPSASEMTYIVSGGALNSTHSLTTMSPTVAPGRLIGNAISALERHRYL